MLNKPHDSSLPALLTVLILASAAGFIGITRGLPSAERLKTVFASDRQIKDNTEAMLAARAAHYEKTEKIRQSGSIYVGQAFLESSSGQETAAEFPAREVVETLRSFFLGSFVGDETWAISIISRMRPKELDFNPRTLMYGGAYIYALCLMLGAAILFGFIPISPDISYFFSHPESVAGIFVIFRILSAVSLVASAVLLFRIVKKRYDISAGLAAAVFCVFSPAVVYHSHIAKPHTYAMFWSLLTFYFAARITEGGGKKNHIFGGIAAGLAMGALLPNGLIFTTIVFAEYLKRRNFAKTLNRDILFALLGMSAVFILTNPYIVFSDLLASTLSATNKTYNYGTLRFSEIPETLTMFFSGAVSWTYVPLLIMGTVSALRSSSAFGWLLAYTAWVCILVNIFLLRHGGLFCSAVPFIAALCALAFNWLFSQGPRVKAAGAAYLFFVIFISGWDSFAVARAFSEKPNLLSAGEWINSNIPHGSSIGVPNKDNLRPAISPYMRFLDYRIYRVEQSVQPDKGSYLPEYMAIAHDSQQYPPRLAKWFEQRYALEKAFIRRRDLLDTIANNHNGLSPQTDVYIYRIRGSYRPPR